MEAADQIVGDLKERGVLVEAGLYEHRYPHCWRCDTPLIWRVADDWIISVEEVRPQLLEANESIAWTPEYMGKRMADWLRNMGDWNISRRRFYGLPLALLPLPCGHMTVIGSKAELAERATTGLDQLQELHRPWIDRVKIRCEACGNEEVERVAEVGDVWLDAGIVPFSTLGWQNPEWKEGGYATGPPRRSRAPTFPTTRTGSSGSRPIGSPRCASRSASGSTRSSSCRWPSSARRRSAPSSATRRCWTSTAGDARLLGQPIPAEEAFDRMGADVMRWQYCAQPPDRNLLFGYGPAHEIKRKLLTLWNSVSFLITYASIEDWAPRYEELEDGPRPEDSAPRPLGARGVQELIDEARRAYDRYLTVEVIRDFETFLDDLSNWYVRRSRRRFWDGDPAAFATLWYPLVQALRVVAPVLPFL